MLPMECYLIRGEILQLNVTYLEEDITFKCYILRTGYYLWMIHNYKLILPSYVA